MLTILLYRNLFLSFFSRHFTSGNNFFFFSSFIFFSLSIWGQVHMFQQLLREIESEFVILVLFDFNSISTELCAHDYKFDSNGENCTGYWIYMRKLCALHCDLWLNFTANLFASWSFLIWFYFYSIDTFHWISKTLIGCRAAIWLEFESFAMNLFSSSCKKDFRKFDIFHTARQSLGLEFWAGFTSQNVSFREN